MNKLILPSAAGTSVMTLFSYLVSDMEHRNFSEPELLAHMVKTLSPVELKKMALPVGWLGHYAAGVLFMAAYKRLPRTYRLRQCAADGLVFGALAGAAGIGIWTILFKLHPAPPGVHKRKYFTHLFFAHLVFGVTTLCAYKATEKIKAKQ